VDQAELGQRSNLSESTVRDFERSRREPTINNLAAIRAALEAAGVEFIAENGGGPGVRLRKNPAGVAEISQQIERWIRRSPVSMSKPERVRKPA
jgi:transcriptional regulator with XRE-family HTH domain